LSRRLQRKLQHRTGQGNLPQKGLKIMPHQPNWVLQPCEVCGCEDSFWFDENQPDSDQFSGTTEEWVGLLAAEGILPPSGKG